MLKNNFVRVPASLEVRAMVVPETFSESDRTVEVCFGSDVPVRMRGWDGDFFEVLSFDARHMDLTRMKNGAPVLDNHNRFGSVVDDTLGVVESPRTDGTRGYCKIRFAKDDKGQRAMDKVRDGIIQNISVGYRVHKYERSKAQKPGEIDTLRAIQWEPFEVSLVPVPEDTNARVRALNDNPGAGFSDVEYTLTNSHTRTMKLDENGNPIDAPEVKNPEPPAEGARAVQQPAPVVTEPTDANGIATRAAANAISAERERVRSINDATKAAGLDASFAARLVDDGTDVDKARALILTELGKVNADKPKTFPAAAVGRDLGTEGFRAAAEDALFMRAMPGEASKPDVLTSERRQAAGQFRGMTLLELAKRSLERIGVNTDGMDKMEIAKRAITSSTSDFPVLLEGTNRRVLLAAYNNMPDTWRRIAKTGSVGDFREYKRIRTGSFSNLDVVNENAQYKNKAIPDGEAEKISAGTKGNTVNVSRKMIVNDDLGAFTGIAEMLGRAAARSIETDVYAMFALNSGAGPTMGDGNPLFHASHNNIMGTGGAPSIALFDAARIALATQKDVSGNDFIDLRPEIWLGPIGLGGAVRVINGSQFDTDVSNKFHVPNKVVGLFREIVDTPRLTGTPWYVLADPMEEPVFEVVFLDGVQEPYLEQEMPFDVDGLRWKIRLDYGVGAIGWRGIQKNAGQ